MTTGNRHPTRHRILRLRPSNQEPREQEQAKVIRRDKDLQQRFYPQVRYTTTLSSLPADQLVPYASLLRATLTNAKSRTYKSIAETTAKSGYRSDLRAEAIARVAALHQANRTKKELPAKKARGSKARSAVSAEA